MHKVITVDLVDAQAAIDELHLNPAPVRVEFDAAGPNGWTATISGDEHEVNNLLSHWGFDPDGQ